jgi:hypothetical protein
MTPEEQKKAFEAELYTWVGKEIAPPTPGLDLGERSDDSSLV